MFTTWSPRPFGEEEKRENEEHRGRKRGGEGGEEGEEKRGEGQH
jgi:hypothetical protein